MSNSASAEETEFALALLKFSARAGCTVREAFFRLAHFFVFEADKPLAEAFYRVFLKKGEE